MKNSDEAYKQPDKPNSISNQTALVVVRALVQAYFIIHYNL